MERRILVAEDSPTQAERLRLLLEGAGHRVDVCRTGREGLELARAAPPDLIISDVMMPEMDGYAFCRAVKAARVTRRIPFVLLTERRTALDILKGLEGGADNFIPKPYEDAVLLDRVRRIFEHLKLRESGHLEVDVHLRVGHREIVLSADKQQIIELLFATFEDLCRLNEQLTEARRVVETHARRLEETVAERTRELRSLFDGVPVGLHRTTVRGQILDANPALVEMLGYPDRASLLGTNAAELYVNRDDHQRFIRILERERVVRDFEVQLWCRDRSAIWVSQSGRFVSESEDRLAFFEGTVQDITERKRAEEEARLRRRAEESLRQTEKVAAMGQLLAGVAHELNNPLSVVLGQAMLVRHQAGEGPLAVRTVKLQQAAERCARIVRNFLALARQHPPERHPVHLNRVVEEALELLAYALRVDNVEVALDFTSDLPPIWGDPHQFHQVVVNLVTNAQQAMHGMESSRRITIGTRVDAAESRVILEVADTGPGMAEEVQARIFEPFFTTKPVGQGTGLGLSLCQGIVESHGGAIHARSTVGEGAVFRIELPVGTPLAAVPEKTATDSVAAIRGKTILVVDDEAEVASVLADMLTRDGHHVETAAHGREALEKLRDRGYDLLLSDLRMPELDGPGLYRELERHHPELVARIIFLTGDTLGPEIGEFLERTRAPSVSKPFDGEEIRRVVQERLRAAGASAESA